MAITNPKLLLIDYCNSLVRCVDIYVEEKLEKLKTTDSNFKLLNNKKQTGKTIFFIFVVVVVGLVAI